MDILLTKNIKLTCSHAEWVDLEPLLNPYIVVENKAYISNLNAGFSVKDMKQYYSLGDVVYGRDKVELIMPIGLWDYTQHLFTEANVIDNRRNTTTEYRVHDFLYSYQKEAVEEMSKYSNGILKAKPGTGKTIMGIALGLKKGKSFLWVNDRIELAKQARDKAIKMFNLPESKCGLLQGDNEMILPYTFTTIQKLHKVLNSGFNDTTKKLIYFDSIIIDEAHHCIGSYNEYKSYFQGLNELSYNNIYGMTATTNRPDGNEHMVFSILGPVKHLVEGDGRTMPATVKNKYTSILVTPELHETFVNKYTSKLIPAKVDSYLLFHDEYIDACIPYINYAINKFNKILIVSPRVAGANYWSDYLTDRGIEHFLVHGSVKKNRDKIYTSKIVVATVDLVKEGFDVPDMECMLCFGRNMHRQIKEQLVGRIERYVEGKKSPEAFFIIPNMKKQKNEKVNIFDLSLESL